MKNNALKKLNMKLGSVVKFKYNENLVKGTLIAKKDNTYLVDVESINNEPQKDKTVITVTTATVLNHLLNQ